MKGRPHSYSDMELAFVKVRCTWPRRQLHAEFCRVFQRTDVTCDALKQLCLRNGWTTGRTGQFTKGQEALNKGKPMPFHPNSAATRFRKGQMPHNSKGAGHERLDTKDGYVILIVDEVNPHTGAATRPVHKHRYLWEQVNGPVPEGMILKCLDGDKTNTDPSNWEAIPRAMSPRLNGRFGRGYDAADPELKPTIMAVAKLEHAAREARKGKRSHG
jgi:hypothetical protein